jgi:transposase, IS30 family
MSEERDRIAEFLADGFGCSTIARRLGRAISTISRELRRNALDSGVYRPHVADGAYLLRRQRSARLERDSKLSAYVTDRLSEGWTPEWSAGWLRLSMERGLRGLCAETRLSLDLPKRAEGREALAVSHPPPCAAPAAPRPGVSR